jgi:hypothetical protein
VAPPASRASKEGGSETTSGSDSSRIGRGARASGRIRSR